MMMMVVMMIIIIPHSFLDFFVFNPYTRGINFNKIMIIIIIITTHKR